MCDWDNYDFDLALDRANGYYAKEVVTLEESWAERVRKATTLTTANRGETKQKLESCFFNC